MSFPQIVDKWRVIHNFEIFNKEGDITWGEFCIFAAPIEGR
jgi:hypothetical protein